MKSLLFDHLYEFYCKFGRIRGEFYRLFFHQSGKALSIMSGCFFTGMRNITIGDYVYINRNCELLAKNSFITIGSYVMIGQNTTLITDNHGYKNIEKNISQQPSIYKGIIVKD